MQEHKNERVGKVWLVGVALVLVMFYFSCVFVHIISCHVFQNFISHSARTGRKNKVDKAINEFGSIQTKI